MTFLYLEEELPWNCLQTTKQSLARAQRLLWYSQLSDNTSRDFMVYLRFFAVFQDFIYLLIYSILSRGTLTIFDITTGFRGSLAEKHGLASLKSKSPVFDRHRK